MSPDDPRYARVPERLIAQLERGHLSPGGLLLLVYVIRRANPYTREFATTLAALSGALHWPWSERHLRNEVHKLPPDVSVQSPTPGQHAGVWVFRVEAPDFGFKLEPDTPPLFEKETPPGTVLEPEGGVQFQESWNNPYRQEGANPHGYSENCRAPPGTGPSPQTETETRLDDAETETETVRAPAGEAVTASSSNGPDQLSALVAAIRDRDELTEVTLRRQFGSRLHPNAYRTAKEALEDRRQRTDRGPLVSEARYVCATLKSMADEGFYPKEREQGR